MFDFAERTTDYDHMIHNVSQTSRV